MNILDGSLRWVITPGKGKVYYLSPLERCEREKYALLDAPSYLPADVVPSSLVKGASECAVTLERNSFGVYSDGRAIGSAEKVLGPKLSVAGDVGIFALNNGTWSFYRNGVWERDAVGELKSWQFGPKGEVIFVSNAGKNDRVFLNGSECGLPRKSRVLACFMGRTGELALQIAVNGREKILVGGKVLVSRGDHGIGALQFAPDGDLVSAQKIRGKWGVYLRGKRVSPECEMVWGWQYTNDGRFIVPVQYKRDSNPVVLVDGSLAYDGRGSLVTWHYDGRLWLLAIEGSEYVLYRDGEVVGRRSIREGVLERWQVTPSGGFALAISPARHMGRTPSACHPLEDFVSSRQWWFKKVEPEREWRGELTVISGKRRFSGNIGYWRLLASGSVYWVAWRKGRQVFFLDGKRTNKRLWRVFA